MPVCGLTRMSRALKQCRVAGARVDDNENWNFKFNNARVITNIINFDGTGTETFLMKHFKGKCFALQLNEFERWITYISCICWYNLYPKFFDRILGENIWTQRARWSEQIYTMKYLRFVYHLHHLFCDVFIKFHELSLYLWWKVFVKCIKLLWRVFRSKTCRNKGQWVKGYK